MVCKNERLGWTAEVVTAKGFAMNLNSYVYVTLRETGAKLYSDWKNRVGVYRAGDVVLMQVWEVCRVFGSVMFPSMDPPIDPVIEVPRQICQSEGCGRTADYEVTTPFNAPKPLLCHRHADYLAGLGPIERRRLE
jgi:hypothetical protein